MSRVKIFKKVLIPCAAGVTNVANEGHTFGPNCVKKGEHGTKPSDLPIYSKECVICREANQAQTPTSSMEETVGNIRRELWVWQDNLKGYRHKIVDVYRKGFSKADSDALVRPKDNLRQLLSYVFFSSGAVIDYLRAPTHGPHRIGAILLSGLAGYIMAMRRGRLRRLFYGTFGILGMAAICYPEEASDALESVILEGRRYFIIAYHFIYGESPKPPEWLEKFTGPMGPKEGTGESVTDLLKFVIAEPVETTENWEEVPAEDKPKARDCRCNPDPDDPRPCVLKCN